MKTSTRQVGRLHAIDHRLEQYLLFLSCTLRMWLATWPEKVMFGTDAFDGGVQQTWEQVAWVASHNARRALSDALSGMVHDNEITAERAKQLARMVLRDNAIAAYRLRR